MGLLQRVQIPASHGHLEGLIETGAEDAQLAAIVCHPHPLYGGTMHNKVVFHTAKSFASLGWPVLRFNFRGVGESTGAYGHGLGEQDDLRAAMDFFGHDRLALAGFSFGSAVALTVGAADGRAAALCGIGLPVASNGLAEAQASTKPKLIVQGRLDEYGPPEALEAWFAAAAEPKQLVLIDGADHFLAGHEEQLKAAIVAYFEGPAG